MREGSRALSNVFGMTGFVKYSFGRRGALGAMAHGIKAFWRSAAAIQKSAAAMVCLAAVCALGCVGCDEAGFAQAEAGEAAVARQVKQCSRLYTAEFKVKKIVVHKDETKLQGSVLGNTVSVKVPASERKIAIPVTATLKAYVDLGDFSEEQVVRQGDKVELVLPDPVVEITSTKVVHKGIKRSVSLIRPRFTDEELTSYAQQGRKAIEESIPKLGLAEQARASAAQTLIPLLRDLGYKEENITITFRSGQKQTLQVVDVD